MFLILNFQSILILHQTSLSTINTIIHLPNSISLNFLQATPTILIIRHPSSLLPSFPRLHHHSSLLLRQKLNLLYLLLFIEGSHQLLYHLLLLILTQLLFIALIVLALPKWLKYTILLPPGYYLLYSARRTYAFHGGSRYLGGRLHLEL